MRKCHLLSQVCSVVPEGDLMGVFRAIVHVLILQRLVDKHEKEEAEDDALPE